MKLTLQRQVSYQKATLGTLKVDGIYECVTLEDVVRDLGPNGEGKVQDETAIPEGNYPVLIGPSPAHQGRLFMRVQSVPFFTGILIHSGNDDVDTHGCILVGQVVDGPDHIHGGSIALPKLFQKVQDAIAQGQIVMLEVKNA